MSVKSVEWARRQTVGGPINKLVLLELCDGHHEYNTRFVFNQKILAAACEMTLEDLWKVLRDLLKAGFWSDRDWADDEELPRWQRIIAHDLFPAVIHVESGK